MNWTEQLDSWDAAIRRGEANDVRAAILHLERRRVPRSLLVRAAGICRRVDCLAPALKLLQPVVRAARKHAEPATDAEKAEYAASLVRAGAVEEGLGLLRPLDARKVPEAYLYQAFGLKSQWDYASSIPLLEKFVEASSDDYWRRIGQLNLAAVLVWEFPGERAVPLLETLSESARNAGLKLMWGNTLELLAQNFILSGEWRKAEAHLEKAREVLREVGQREEFIVRKWEALAQVRRHGLSVESRKELDQVRHEARERQHWETLRQCDLFEAEATSDDRLWQKLYFGTPFPAFRARVRAGWAVKELPLHYDWILGQGEAKQVWDLHSGRVTPRGGSIKVAGLSHRLLRALASDFYRPQRLATLHFRIYPDEFYNATSSPQRVHYALQDLRKTIKGLRVPLSVHTDEGHFWLEATSPIALRVPEATSKVSAEAPRLGELREEWPSEPFSLAEASAKLGASPRTTLRLLQAGLENAELGRTGKASKTRYHFLQTEKKSA